MSSVQLNIAEGNGKRSFPDRKKYFTQALGSASEVSAILDIAKAYHLITNLQFDSMQEDLLQVYKMVFKLK